MRRWTALAILVASVCLAMPASAACPGCCAPAANRSLAYAVAAACSDCDPLVRPARVSDLAALPDPVLAAAAQPSSLLPRILAPCSVPALLRHACAPRRAAPLAISPLRL